jgi:NAD(P)-dependent dehydrogenase (short-subunit alcohol dehydrogenase family)
MRRYEGKAVVVTGGGSGIGRATAKRLASEGGRVLVADINLEGAEETAKQIRDAGGDAVATKCDVSKEEDVKALIAGAVERFGKLDCVASVAGVGKFIRTTETTMDDWNRMIGINLTGSFLVSRESIPHLIKTKGALVLTSSIAGVKSHPYSAAYCASKGGVTLLTKALAVEYARKNIRINCVAPGGVETPLIGSFALPPGGSPMQISRIAPIMDRMATPEEVASAIAFLGADEASYVCGATLVVDGAMSCLGDDHGKLRFLEGRRGEPRAPRPRRLRRSRDPGGGIAFAGQSHRSRAARAGARSR